MRTLYKENPGRFEILAVGSRDNWLADYPTSTIKALQEVVAFLAEQGVDVEGIGARESGRRLVRDAVDEILTTSDELEIRRMKNAEKAFRAVQEDLVKRGVISPGVAYERHRTLFGTA